MNVITTHKRLTRNQESWIVKRISLHQPYHKIKAEFEQKFGRSINPMTISRVKKRYIDVVTHVQDKIIENNVINSAAIKQQSYRLIQRKMDKAEGDMNELDTLTKKLRSGEISRSTYDDLKKTYETVTLSELTRVADSAHTHMKGAEDDPARPEDEAALKMLIAGIQAGNPVQLVQVLNPTINQTSKNQEASGPPVNPA